MCHALSSQEWNLAVQHPAVPISALNQSCCASAHATEGPSSYKREFVRKNFLAL